MISRIRVNSLHPLVAFPTLVDLPPPLGVTSCRNPTNTRRLTNAGTVLTQRRRRWANIVPTLVECINPLPAKLSYLNFHPLQVVSRYRETQLEVGEKYSKYLFIFKPYIYKS